METHRSRIKEPSPKDVEAKFLELGWANFNLGDREDQKELIDTLLMEMLPQEEASELIRVADTFPVTYWTPQSQRDIGDIIQSLDVLSLIIVDTKERPQAMPRESRVFDGEPGVRDPLRCGALAMVLMDYVPAGQIKHLMRNTTQPDGVWRNTTRLVHVERGLEQDPSIPTGPREWELPADYVAERNLNKHAMRMSVILLISCPEDWYKKEKSSLMEPGRCYLYVRPKGLETLPIDPDKGDAQYDFSAKVEFVLAGAGQLQAILTSENVPAQVKTITCLGNIFTHTRMWIKERTEVLTYAEAAEKWRLPVRPSPTVDVYHASIAMTTLGPCYTMEKNIDVQVHRRLGAALASTSITPPPITVVSKFRADSKFVVGQKDDLILTILGAIVALVSPTSWDINALRQELAAPATLAEHFGWSPFTKGLFIQLRLVAENIQSTTIRFAIASLQAFSTVSSHAPEVMRNEVKMLQQTRSEMEDAPYCSCVSPVPPKLMVASQPYICYFGVKLYARDLDEKEASKFADYNVDGVAAKLSKQSQTLVDCLVNCAPRMETAVLAEMMMGLSIERAEHQLDRLPAEAKTKVMYVLEDSTKESPITNSIRAKKHREAEGRVLAVARIRLNLALKEWQIKKRMAHDSANTPEAKTRVMTQSMEMDQLLAEAESQLTPLTGSWEEDLGAGDKKVCQELIASLSAALKQVEGRIAKGFQMTE